MPLLTSCVYLFEFVSHSDQYVIRLGQLGTLAWNGCSESLLWPPPDTIFPTGQECVEQQGHAHTSSRPHSLYLELQNFLHLHPCFQNLRESLHSPTQGHWYSKGSCLGAWSGCGGGACEGVRSEEGGPWGGRGGLYLCSCPGSLKYLGKY